MSNDPMNQRNFPAQLGQERMNQTWRQAFQALMMSSLMNPGIQIFFKIARGQLIAILKLLREFGAIYSIDYSANSRRESLNARIKDRKLRVV